MTQTTHRSPSAVLDATLAVETPEQVSLTYTIAGFGSRALAALLDTTIIVVASIVLALLFGALVVKGTLMIKILSVVDLSGPTKSDVGLVLAILILLEFVLLWGYYVLFEGLNDGQTPGKRFFSIRVVRDGGFTMTFAASAVRNLARIIDAQPGFSYGVGAISVLMTKSGKRLGDILAGTFVVHEAKMAYSSSTIAMQSAAVGELPTSVTVSATPVLSDTVSVTPVLSDDEYDVLDRYMTRRNSITIERRHILVRQIADRLQRHLDPGTLSPSASPSAALLELFERERDARSGSVAMQSGTGVRREQHAIVALGVARWNDFSTLLANVRRTGLHKMSAAQVSDFVERYRQITSDLARLQTASRGRTFDAMFFVSRLVAGGHAVLYRERRNTLETVVRYITDDVPREIRRSVGVIALAAVLLFLPAAIAYVAVVTHPAVANTFVEPVMMERAARGAVRMQKHEGYVTIPPEDRPTAASFIITNNVQISYAAFALGLTAGLGTILILVFNGVSFGGGAGIFTAKGVGSLLLAFVAPHGVLELSAICIAGGGGLLIASALVLPGDVTRSEALVTQGRRAIRLITAATLFLIVAGTIEGLISPRVWPIQWKVAVSAATAIAMILYISLGRRQTPTVADVPAVALIPMSSKSGAIL